MVPQPKCRYSFLFSEFLIIGPVPVCDVIGGPLAVRSRSGICYEIQKKPGKNGRISRGVSTEFFGASGLRITKVLESLRVTKQREQIT